MKFEGIRKKSCLLRAPIKKGRRKIKINDKHAPFDWPKEF